MILKDVKALEKSLEEFIGLFSIAKNTEEFVVLAEKAKEMNIDLRFLVYFDANDMFYHIRLYALGATSNPIYTSQEVKDIDNILRFYFKRRPELLESMSTVLYSSTTLDEISEWYMKEEENVISVNENNRKLVG